MHRSMGDGDSSEFAFRSAALGVAHPPGYPLLILLSSGVHRLLATCSSLFGSDVNVTESAFVFQNLSCVVYSALAANFVFLICYKQLRCGMLLSLSAVCLFAFSRGVWTYSHQLEVFPLNNCLMACLMYIFGCFREAVRCNRRTLGSLMSGALVSGLALSNQHTSILFVLPVVGMVFVMDSKTLRRPMLFLAVSGCFAAGLGPYLLLPVRALLDSTQEGSSSYNLQSWGAHNSWSSFVGHLLRQEFGTFSLSVYGRSTLLPEVYQNWAAYGASVLRDVTPWGVAMISSACVIRVLHSGYNKWVSPRKANADVPAPREFMVWISLWLLYVAFMNTLSNLDSNVPHQLGILERFWQQPLLPLAVLFAISAKYLFYWLSLALPLQDFAAAFRIILKLATFVYVINATLVANFSECDHSKNDIVELYGSLLLRHVPQDSLLMMNGDMLYFSSNALQTVKDVRPDVCIICQTLLPAEWYVSALAETARGRSCVSIPAGRKSLFPDPRNKTTFTYKDLFDSNLILKKKNNNHSPSSPQRRVFLGGMTIPGDDSFNDVYGFAPFGMLQEVLPAAEFDAIASLAEEERHPSSHVFWNEKRRKRYGPYVNELMRSLPLSLPPPAASLSFSFFSPLFSSPVASGKRRMTYGAGSWEFAALESIYMRYVVMGEQLLIYSYVEDPAVPDDGLISQQLRKGQELLALGDDENVLDTLALLSLNSEDETAVVGGFPVRLCMLLVARRFLNTALQLHEDVYAAMPGETNPAGLLNALQLQIGVLQNMARFFMESEEALTSEPDSIAATTKKRAENNVAAARLLRHNIFGRQVLKELVQHLEAGQSLIVGSADERSEEVRETLAEVKEQLMFYKGLQVA